MIQSVDSHHKEKFWRTYVWVTVARKLLYQWSNKNKYARKQQQHKQREISPKVLSLELMASSQTLRTYEVAQHTHRILTFTHQRDQSSLIIEHECGHASKTFPVFRAGCLSVAKNTRSLRSPLVSSVAHMWLDSATPIWKYVVYSRVKGEFCFVCLSQRYWMIFFQSTHCFVLSRK